MPKFECDFCHRKLPVDQWSGLIQGVNGRRDACECCWLENSGGGLPFVKGGQGRSDEEVAEAGGMLALLCCVVLIAGIVVAVFGQIGA